MSVPPSKYLASLSEPFLLPLGYKVYITGAPEETNPHVVFYDYASPGGGFYLNPALRQFQQPRIQIRLVSKHYEAGYVHLDDLLYELRKTGKQKYAGDVWGAVETIDGPFLLSRDKDGWYNIIANVMISRCRESS